MISKNPYSQRRIEKILTLAAGGRLDRRTRAYIRKTARNIEKAYEIGVKDRASGKSAASEDMIPALQSDSDLLRSVSRLAYMAYEAGFFGGGGKGV